MNETPIQTAVRRIVSNPFDDIKLGQTVTLYRIGVSNEFDDNPTPVLKRIIVVRSPGRLRVLEGKEHVHYHTLLKSARGWHFTAIEAINARLEELVDMRREAERTVKAYTAQIADIKAGKVKTLKPLPNRGL